MHCECYGNGNKSIYAQLIIHKGGMNKKIIQLKDVNIGTNIRRVRMLHQMKQVEVVRKLQLKGVDISVYSYNRIEKGTQNPTVSCLIELCDILNCDMNQIFGV